MSTKAVIDFVEHIAGSQNLEQEFDAIARMGGGGTQEMSEFGRKQGFEFSPEEFAQVTQATFMASGGEMNEEELGHVSGGQSGHSGMTSGIILSNLGLLKLP